MALLSVRNVTRRFGGIVAIDDVSLEVEQGEVVGLIGPNGAGKTTLFNVVTRLYKPDAGELDFDGKTLLHTPPHRIVRRGIARTFQNVELFRSMTVLDNVLVGAHTRTKPFAGATPLPFSSASTLRPSFDFCSAASLYVADQSITPTE